MCGMRRLCPSASAREHALSSSVPASRSSINSRRSRSSVLCAINDMFSNRIVGYSIDSRMKSRLATTALHSAVARRGEVAGCIVHSDRGSQFRSRRFVHALSRYDMAGSMGRVGAAGDNAAMEMLLSVSSGDWGGFEKSEEMARVVPLQTPHGFTFGLAIADPAGDVGLGRRVNLGPGQDDRVQCAV